MQADAGQYVFQKNITSFRTADEKHIEADHDLYARGLFDRDGARHAPV
jgi:hypothetical protein